MAASGPKSPGTLANDASVGTVAWSTPGNAGSSDNSYATVTLSAGDSGSNYLKATNFGFTTADIPSGSVIQGIVVQVEYYASRSSRASWGPVRLVKSGSVVGNVKADGDAVSTSEVYKTLGSSGDMWGTTWTDSQVRSSGFGVAISFEEQQTAASSYTVYVDHIRVTVYYQEPAAPTITSTPAVDYGTDRSAVGPNNSATVTFTAEDVNPGDQGSNALTYQVRTAASGGGTLIESGTCTHGVSKQITLTNAEVSSLSEGNNTLYLSILDGDSQRSSDESFTLKKDTVAPSVSFDLHTPDPATAFSYSVQFDGTDATSTGSNQMLYGVRTGANNTGNLLKLGTFTQGTNRSTGTVSDPGLVEGSNTRYLRINDGAGNVAETSFTVDFVPPDVSIALVVDSSAHTSTVNTKAALEATGAVVATVLDNDLTTTDLSGYDLIVVMRTDPALNSTVASELRTYADTYGIPLFLSMSVATTTGTGRAYPGSAMGLTGTVTFVSDTSGHTEIDVIDNSHEITDEFSLGALQITTGANFVNWLDTGASFVGVELAEGDPGGTNNPALIAIERDTNDLSSNPIGARVVIWGNLYAGQTDYSTDGKALLAAIVEWLLFAGEEYDETTGSDLLLVSDTGSDYTEEVETSGSDLITVVDGGSYTEVYGEVFGFDTVLVAETGSEHTQEVELGGRDIILILDDGSDLLAYNELSGRDIILVLDGGTEFEGYLETGGADTVLVVDGGSETVNLYELRGRDVIQVIDGGVDMVGYLEVSGIDVVLVTDSGSDYEEISELTGRDLLLISESGTDTVTVVEVGGRDVILVTDEGTDTVGFIELSGVDVITVVDDGTDQVFFFETSGGDTLVVVESGTESENIIETGGQDVILYVEGGFSGAGILELSGRDTLVVVDSGSDWFALIERYPLVLSFLTSMVGEPVTTLRRANPYELRFVAEGPFSVQLEVE